MGMFKSDDPTRKIETGDLETLIGPEAYFQGVMTPRGSLRVEGEIEGDIHEAHTVIIGRNGRVQGNINAENVIVGGR